MDFTQIMQRYTRLRERYEQGEIDADSFEQQVNGMIYKDEQGRTGRSASRQGCGTTTMGQNGSRTIW